jgi:hypothetical protein
MCLQLQVLSHGCQGRQGVGVVPSSLPFTGAPTPPDAPVGAQNTLHLLLLPAVCEVQAHLLFVLGGGIGPGPGAGGSGWGRCFTPQQHRLMHLQVLRTVAALAARAAPAVCEAFGLRALAVYVAQESRARAWGLLSLV